MRRPQSEGTSRVKANGVSKRREMIEARMKIYSGVLFPTIIRAASGEQRPATAAATAGRMGWDGLWGGGRPVSVRVRPSYAWLGLGFLGEK